MFWWVKWIFVLILALWIGYHRYWLSKLIRSRTSGLPFVESSVLYKTEQFEFYNLTEQYRNGYLEFKLRIYKDGICGNMNIPPSKRPCTPYVHIHPYQLEKFSIVQGDFAYQIGDQVYTCDKSTCPKPIVIHPNIVHAFWMNSNRDDLILIVNISPMYGDRGLTASAYENIAGSRRDKYMDLWQALVYIDAIESYPVFLPLWFVKLLFRIGASIGQLLGYQKEYEEYTTKVF